MQKLGLFGLWAAVAAPAVLAQGTGAEGQPMPATAPAPAPSPAADPQAAPDSLPAEQVAPPMPTAAAPPAPTVFDSQVAFSPTYSSGYYYASPYSGYTSLSYYASIYTARRFGG